MDELFREAIKQSPVLSLMLGLVMLFLRHVKDLATTNAQIQQRMMDSHAKRTDEFISTVKEVRTEFISTVKEMKHEDKESRDLNTAALNNLGTQITKLNERDRHR